MELLRPVGGLVVIRKCTRLVNCKDTVGQGHVCLIFKEG